MCIHICIHTCIYKYVYVCISWCVHVHISSYRILSAKEPLIILQELFYKDISTYIYISPAACVIGRQRCFGFLIVQVSFRQKATNYRTLLQEMKYTKMRHLIHLRHPAAVPTRNTRTQEKHTNSRLCVCAYGDTYISIDKLVKIYVCIWICMGVYPMRCVEGIITGYIRIQHYVPHANSRVYVYMCTHIYVDTRL